ncbi:phosphonate ABC transporter ATP-binding protein [Desulfotomaculum defluvii]
MESHEIVRAEKLVKVYANGVVGLKGIDATIYRGEMVGVLGASGSGKTTFFRLINGFISPTEGNLYVMNQSMRGLSHQALRKLRSSIAMVSQNHNIIPGLSVARNVIMGKLGQVPIYKALRILFHLTEKEIMEVWQVLGKLELAEKIYDRATDLSGGQQQRVAIARALLGNAKLILADEPIASVDSRTAENILNIFTRLNREKNVTIVTNLHQEDFALHYCTRVLVLDKGRLIYNGPPDGWLSQRRFAYAQ